MTSHHSVRWIHDAAEQPRPHFACTAPDTEPCRHTCAYGQCETIPCVHDEVAAPGKCLFIEWMDATDGAEQFGGPDDSTPRNGPISIEWTGDEYVWENVPLTWAQTVILKTAGLL